MKLLGALLLIANLCVAQVRQASDFTKVFKTETENLKEVTDKYLSSDFSILWNRNTPALGYIGDSYERLSMILLTVKPSGEGNVYLVTGKSRVKDNVCSYTGKLIVNHIFMTNEKHGIVTGSYQFMEDSTQSHPGIFAGSFGTTFIIDDSGKMQYDDNSNKKDYFINNAFIGVWKAYKGNLTMKANWGDKRIPDSGDLDNGKTEFSVNEKYLRSGWKNYKKAKIDKDNEAIQKEEKVWW
jgi:hypothetical protein